MSIENVDQKISASQCKAARALLGITQPELADLASLGLSTVVDFERGRRQLTETAVRSLQIALEHAGAKFIPENGGGPGVRLRKRRGHKS
jgi:DNA-binding transcriptional regulator YiaG